MIGEWFSRAWFLFAGKRRAEVDEELQFHIERQVEANVAALGARRGTVIGLILRETLVLAGIAVAVTVPIAAGGALAVRSQLFGVSIADPLVYGAGILTIGLVAALAGFIPARRAARVDPARALRTE
ncbi:MAG TPA: FtsX-like permease family protein [Terracidiphilus sp.]|jgi:ABC-type antimicrobial peptide transport system permease subunit|nr:FtsX-like permease family protein [Terracidiphilus sp.]